MRNGFWRTSTNHRGVEVVILKMSREVILK
jgi:hypothetical protein